MSIVRKENSKKKSSVMQKFNFIITVMLCFYWLTPYFSLKIKHTNLLFLITFGWVLTASIVIVTSYKIRSIKVHYNLILIIIWISWFLSLKFIGYSTATWGNFYENIYFYFPIFIYYFYIDYMDNKHLLQLPKILLYVICCNVIDNIRLLILYPGANEVIYSTWGVHFFNMNIGATEFSQLSLFAFLIFLALFINKHKMIYAICMAINMLYIFLAGRATTVLILAFGILYIITINKAEKIKQSRSTIFYILVLVFLILSIFVLPSLLEFVSSFITNKRIGIRFKELATILMGKKNIYSSVSSGASRISLYIMSIKTFLSSPQTLIFGIGDHVSLFKDVNKYNIGQHSEILDMCAKYGLIGIIMLSLIFKFYSKNMLYRYKKSKYFIYFKSIFIIFIIYSLLNFTFFPNVSIIIFLIIPLILKTSSQEIIE